MSFRSRLLDRIVDEFMQEAPEYTPDERDHLAQPRSAQARRLLAFAATLDGAPIDPTLLQYLPVIRRFFEQEALGCEVRDADEHRARVAAWLDRVRAAVA